MTLLHAFRAAVDDLTAAAVETIAVTLESFDAALTDVGRFPGEVVYLVDIQRIVSRVNPPD